MTAEVAHRLDSTACTLYDNVCYAGESAHAEAWSPTWLADIIPLDFPSKSTAVSIKTHPFPRHYAVTRDNAPRSACDVADTHSWHRTEIFNITKEAFGITEQLCIPISDTGENFRMLLLGRPETPYSSKELELASHLQRLLISLDSHVRHLQLLSKPSSGKTPTDRAADYRLTSRQLIVLHLLAEGLPAAVIARRLAISQRTVTKHLENLYRKLGTTDRLGTVLLAQRLGIILSHN
ncbi:hypothetical protein Amsp01_090160 [Amycolatopsis sp. NBRC 101858]|uniref:helix-turn-helix transcriptional regulator n=1 Tax=Amycolatopsis sp. NBRC 101858 TaxID=3032200 RepID=UPI0024A3AE13|nr:LuxR C-terminal-related transcriptional regulator [Amycolatopsis sp. NBRC 101858]GLY42993.1 hypothetical protein Amsp01_090160 [Amycolatopsis sp. NBRC 101858]